MLASRRICSANRVDNLRRPESLHAVHSRQKSSRSGLPQVLSTGVRVQSTAEYPSRHRSNRSPKSEQIAELRLAMNLERQQLSRAISGCDSRMSPRMHLLSDCYRATGTHE